MTTHQEGQQREVDVFDFGIVQVRPLSYAPEIAEVILESRNEDNVSMRRIVDHYPDGSLGFPCLTLWEKCGRVKEGA